MSFLLEVSEQRTGRQLQKSWSFYLQQEPNLKLFQSKLWVEDREGKTKNEYKYFKLLHVEYKYE